MISEDRNQLFQNPPLSTRAGSQVAHYSRDRFFQFDINQGQVKDYHHQRNILVGEDFIVSLLKGLEPEGVTSTPQLFAKYRL